VKIGDVAEKLNMPSSTIRYYEKRGLIPSPARVSGRREFDEGVVASLRFIQMCQTAGFSIQEISDLMSQFLSNPDSTGICRPAVKEKRESVQKQIEDLKQVDAVLGQMLKCECKSIEQCVSFSR